MGIPKIGEDEMNLRSLAATLLQHPPSWQWVDGRLLDGKGKPLASALPGLSPGTAALLAEAPEILEALHWSVMVLDGDDDAIGGMEDCAVACRALLQRIEEKARHG